MTECREEKAGEERSCCPLLSRCSPDSSAQTVQSVSVRLGATAIRFLADDDGVRPTKSFDLSMPSHWIHGPGTTSRSSLS